MERFEVTPEAFTEFLQSSEHWHTYASVAGRGKNKKLQVMVGAHAFRVLDHDKCVFYGIKPKDIDKAVQIYNSL